MSHNVFDKADLMEIRKNLAIQRNSGGYGYWNSGDTEQKKYKMGKARFSKERQAILDEAKQKLSNSYDDNYDDPFF